MSTADILIQHVTILLYFKAVYLFNTRQPSFYSPLTLFLYIIISTFTALSTGVCTKLQKLSSGVESR